MRFQNIFKKKSTRGGFTNPEIKRLSEERAREVKDIHGQLSEIRHKLKIEDKKRELEEEKQRLDAIRGLLPAEEEAAGGGFNAENLLMQILLPKLLGNKNVSPPQSQEFSPAQNFGQKGVIDHTIPPQETAPLESKKLSEKVSLSDEEIERILDQLPKKVLKLAKNMPDPVLRAYIMKYGSFAEETIQRAIARIKG